MNAPPGPVHEGDVITYTIAYANTSLITQTITITDFVSYNLLVDTGSITPADKSQLADSAIIWNLGDVSPGYSGEVSFRARVALLPSLHDGPLGISSLSTSSPAYVLPAAVACDTTRFWANGVTRQPPIPNPHTIQVQIPPGSNPSAMWLLMKGTDNVSPTVESYSAQLLTTTHKLFGASVWTAAITAAMIDNGEVTVVTHNPRDLNAIFLFDKDDPPFDPKALDVFYNEVATATYTLEMPSVATETMEVLLPFMDITYLTDNLLPDDRKTTVTVEYGGQPSQTITANDPNLGNGLLMTQFPIDIGPLSDTVTPTKVLTITVDTEDSIYTLGPRICRPVNIENTALLCSPQAGCISSTVKNSHLDPDGGIYLPIIMKSSS